MRKSKDGSYVFRLPLYGTRYLVRFDYNEEDDRAHFTDLEGGNYALEFNECDPMTIAHECVHAAMYTLDRVGIEITPDNHEALCYLVEWLVEQVNKALEKENGQKV